MRFLSVSVLIFLVWLCSTSSIGRVRLPSHVLLDTTPCIRLLSSTILLLWLRLLLLLLSVVELVVLLAVVITILACCSTWVALGSCRRSCCIVLLIRITSLSSCCVRRHPLLSIILRIVVRVVCLRVLWLLLGRLRLLLHRLQVLLGGTRIVRLIPRRALQEGLVSLLTRCLSGSTTTSASSSLTIATIGIPSARAAKLLASLIGLVATSATTALVSWTLLLWLLAAATTAVTHPVRISVGVTTVHVKFVPSRSLLMLRGVLSSACCATTRA